MKRVVFKNRLRAFALLSVIMLGAATGCKKDKDNGNGEEELPSYTVQFDAKGGQPKPANQTVKKGDKVVKPTTDPVLEGFTFEGWEKADKTLWNFATETVEADMTLYAVYNSIGGEPTFTVIFNVNEGDTQAPETQVRTEGEKVVEPPEPLRIGFTFMGWAIGSPTGAIWNFETGVVTADMTLYAVWEAAGESLAEIDDVVAEAGRYQVKISWQNNAEVEKVRITWDDNAHFRDVEEPDMDITIDDLQEREYTFLLYAFDSDNNPALPEEVTVTPFGTIFEATLTNRQLSKIIPDKGAKTLELEWKTADDDEVGLWLNYTDITNNSASVFVEPTEDVTDIDDIDITKPVYYSSVYKIAACFDDLFAKEELVFEIKEILPTKWAKFDLKGCSHEGRPGLNDSKGYGPGDIRYLWDGVIGTELMYEDYGAPEDAPLPNWCTWYLGETVVLDRFNYYCSSRKWADETAKIFEVWGSMEPDTEYDPDLEGGTDREFDDSWTMLGHFDLTDDWATLNAAPQNQPYEAELTVKNHPVRYLRLRTIDIWDHRYGTGAWHKEVKIFGVVQPE